MSKNLADAIVTNLEDLTGIVSNFNDNITDAAKSFAVYMIDYTKKAKLALSNFYSGGNKDE